MSDASLEHDDSPPPPASVDSICDVFESAWLAGYQPRIEDFLPPAGAVREDGLLQELLLAEWELRRRHAQPVELQTYLERFAESRQSVVDAWHAYQAERQEATDNGSVSGDATAFQTAPALEQVGTTIDRYKLLEKLGEGGFGTVWVAEQREPVCRRVALKLIKLGMDTKQVVARFEAERQALALMDHPNIAKVFDAGATQSGRPYFVMELVCGIPITRYCDQEKLSTEARLHLFMKVCHTVQHAHLKGIIHRDLKPSNILVTLHDGVPVPKVIDFGIAKATQQALTDKTIYTQLAQLIGTPEYMSPEQAEMSGLGIDTRSDIYSLGVLLYELLTGRTPFEAKRLQASGYEGMLRIIREEEPPRPSTKLSNLGPDVTIIAENRRTDAAKLRNGLRGDLDCIVMKALEKDRNRRYEAASNFAADIERFLNNEAVVARPPSVVYLMRKFGRRHRGPVMAALTLLVVLCLGLAGTSLGLVSANREAGRARLAEIDATRQRDGVARAREEARQLLYTSDMERAQQAWEANNVGLVLELLNRHRDRKRPGDFEWYYLWRLCRRSLLTPTVETNSPALAVALSPDGKTLACGGMDGEIILINTSTHQTRKLGTHASQVFCVAYSRDGSLLASAGGDRTVRLWDVGAAQEIERIAKYTDWVKSVDFSPNGKLLAIGSYDGHVDLWNIATREFEWRSEDSRYVDAVAFSPDGTIVASGSYGIARPGISPGIKLRDAVTGQVLRQVPVAAAFGELICFSPDGDSLATGSNVGVVRLFDRKLKMIGELEGHASAVQSLVYLDSNTLVSGSSDNTVRLWDLATHSLRDTLKGHSGAVRSVARSRDGKLLVSASMDHTVKLWQMDGQSEKSVLKEHKREVWSVALSPDGSMVASGSADGTVKLWDAATGVLKRNLQVHTDEVTCVAYSPDGKTVASSGDDRAIIVWDTTTGEVKRKLTGHTDTLWSLAFLDNGLTLASTGEDGTVRLWSLATDEGRTLVKQSDKIGCLAVWQDRVPSEWLAFGGWDNYGIELWDLHTGEQRLALRGHLGPVKAMAFMSTGRELVTGSWDGTVRLWNLKSGGRSEVLIRHTDMIASVAVSPDGATLACGAYDGAVKLLDVSTRRERAALKGHLGSVLSLAFSGDGKLLVSGGSDKTVRLWRAASDEEVIGANISSMPLR